MYRIWNHHLDVLSKMVTMDAKKKDKLITGIVVAIVVALMAAFAAIIYMYGQGSMDETMFMIASSMFSGAMFLIVVVYGAISLRNQNSRKYQEFEEEYKKKQQE